MKNTSHGFVALRLEGGILPAEFFQKVANLSAKGQKPGDYRLSKGLSIKDEIGRAWRSAVGEWQNYQERRVKEGVDQQEIGVRRWLVRLLKEVLQFEDIEAIKGHTNLGSRAFPLTHRACGGTVPMVLTTCDNLLDKGALRFGEDGKRRSPHGLVQEFLNADESSLWGIVAIAKTVADNPADPAAALLKLKVIDPASGSGHFLLAAARRLAVELARLAADTGQPDEALYRQCMRTVVRHCIHGVDLNPMAVELCRMALWLSLLEKIVCLPREIYFDPFKMRGIQLAQEQYASAMNVLDDALLRQLPEKEPSLRECKQQLSMIDEIMDLEFLDQKQKCFLLLALIDGVAREEFDKILSDFVVEAHKNEN